MNIFDAKMAARTGLFSLSGYLAGCGRVWFGLVWFGLVWFGLVREEGDALVGWLVGWLVALKCFCM